MKTLEEIMQMFPYTEKEKWSQHANGKGWVYITAKVSPSAFVEGMVYGDAQVSGDAWKNSPLYIQGTSHSLTLCSHTEIAIGCHVLPIVEWKKRYKEIGRKEGYTEVQIEEYGDYIVLLENAAKRLATENKTTVKLGGVQ